MATPEIKATEVIDKGSEIAEISRKDVKDVQSLKDYYNDASEQVKKDLVNEFKRYVEPDLKGAPWLQDSFEEESYEIGEDDVKKVEELLEYQQKFEEALKNHPNIDWTSRMALHNMVIYGTMRDSENQIKKVVANENESDGYKIEK